MIVTANCDLEEVRRNPRIQVNARHLKWEPAEGEEAVLDQARDLLDDTKNPYYGKPKILSSDGANIWRALIRDIQGMMRTDGSQHFEHFDQPFSREVGLRGRATRQKHYFEEVQNRMAQVGAKATPLEPGGVLGLSDDGGRLLWNGEPAVLMGWSFYGFLTTERHNLKVFFDLLAKHRINFTRVWCVEQWTALGLGQSVEGEWLWRSGLCPFRGGPSRRVGGGRKYDLSKLDGTFFRRLHEFVDRARKAGVVVQLSLFDRAGLRDLRKAGHWRDSPYNAVNNTNGFLVDIENEYPKEFTGVEGTAIGDVHEALVRRVLATLRGAGNVMVEIGNEFRGRMPNEAEWHHWIAGLLHEKVR